MTGVAPNDAGWAAAALAVLGAAVGGAWLHQDIEAGFLHSVRTLTDGAMTFRPMSVRAPVETFTGGLDLAATLALGCPVRSEGVLVQDAKLLFRNANQLEPISQSLISDAMDSGHILLIATTDLSDPDATLGPRIVDRLAFCVANEPQGLPWTALDIVAARKALTAVTISEDLVAKACATALAYGVEQPRAVLHMIKIARAIAALSLQSKVSQSELALAARLVLAHRATQIPQPKNTLQEQQHNDQPDNVNHPATEDLSDTTVIKEAVQSAIPPHVLRDIELGLGSGGSARQVKTTTATKSKSKRGRRTGARRSSSLSGQRLDVLATLRAAAPWQMLRRRLAKTDRMIVTRDDFHIARVKQRNSAAAIFAVDASGSTAFQRLAEAKGAVEAILAECYVRRDKVALISFRSKSAEELLPPTRSLERARRALSALPGGGGTPLSAALDQSFAMACQLKRTGTSPIVIFLTDGRANITRNGNGDKVTAMTEAQAAAKLFQSERISSLVIDVSPDPQRHARQLAEAMGARYLAMPRASATEIARPVSDALRSAHA